MADKNLNIKVRAAGAKKTKKELQGVSGGISKLGKAAAVAGASFFAASGLIRGFSAAIRLSGEQELAEKKLETALGRTSNALLKQASALQQVSMFGDETIIEAQALIAAFVKDEEQIKLATKATLDLAAAKGMDLNAAADLVSKTLGSSTNAMSRYGIEVQGAVGSTDRLNSLTESIADKFGGQAAAQAGTMTGQITQMKNALGDTGEAMGVLFAPIVIKMSNAFKEAANNVSFFLKQLKGVNDVQLGEVIEEEEGFFKKLFDMFAKVNKDLGSTISLIKERTDAQKAQIKSFSDFHEKDQELILTLKQKHSIGMEIVELEAQALEIRKFGFEFLKAEPVVYEEIKNAITFTKIESEKLASFTARTATSLATSAIMGDSVTEAFKRMLLQQVLITAQMKLQKLLQDKISAMAFASGGTGGFIASGIKFLFGASPTQTSPSASSSGSAKITINQNFGGMGVIDHNFAANSIIPAINKAVSTGQARITR